MEFKNNFKKVGNISVVIPTFNCANNLNRCMKSIEWVNEIIVVDMGSTDGTIEIAKKYGAKIFQRIPKDGNFDSNRKFGMEKTSGGWILKIDSDEILSPALQQEIKHILKHDDLEFNGFNIYNHIYMFNQRITHGFIKNGSHELRLVRNGKWYYNPYKFHQQITVIGQTNYLKNYYSHYNVENVNKFIQKMNTYTSLDAKYYKNKLLVTSVFLAPFRTFIKLFFLQMGFLDNATGFKICYLYSLYNIIEKIKIWEKLNI